MKLLVILLCLLSERFLIHSLAYRRFYWFSHYCSRIENLIQQKGIINPWMQLAAIILPIIIPVACVYFIFQSLFFGLFSFIFCIIIFLYCLGPDNVFYPVIEPSTENAEISFVGAYFAKANRQLFSVLFWFILVGPITTLAYRLITLCCSIGSVSSQANQLANLLEWIPARISALLYLLVGNFQRGFAVYSTMFVSSPELNRQLLSECGLQAVRVSDLDEVPMPLAERLVEHATVVCVVLIALFYLIAY